MIVSNRDEMLCDHGMMLGPKFNVAILFSFGESALESQIFRTFSLVYRTNRACCDGIAH